MCPVCISNQNQELTSTFEASTLSHSKIKPIYIACDPHILSDFDLRCCPCIVIVATTVVSANTNSDCREQCST